MTIKVSLQKDNRLRESFIIALIVFCLIVLMPLTALIFLFIQPWVSLGLGLVAVFMWIWGTAYEGQ